MFYWKVGSDIALNSVKQKKANNELPNLKQLPLPMRPQCSPEVKE